MNRRLAAAMAVAIGVATPVVGPPAGARAAVPAVAATYSKLMYRSLTADATMANLRITLATQQNDLKARTAELAAAAKANDTAEQRAVTTTAAHRAVHERLKLAERALTDAKNAVARASQQHPRNASAVARAKKKVVIATSTRDARRTRLHRAAAVMKAARADVRTTAAAETRAGTAQRDATAAIQRTQNRIASAGTAASYAAQAAMISADVVNEIRPQFTIDDTSNVYGVTVHRNVAYAFKRMLDDARADGVVMSGGGFRTKQRQIELRTINGCPDIWTAPASSCRIPTAIPGRSLHEIGLAVDITSGGKTLTRTTKAFTWLSAHAAEYGFVNLPSEAWHWSITGG